MIYNKFLNSKDLENIKNHKYKSGSYTDLDNYLNYYWNKWALYIPKTIAPNLITLIGFFFNVSPFIFVIINDYTLEKEIPAWLLVLSAIFLFIYQTLDALDGKHARNLKLSSPLGQLFDHGCDALGSIFILGLLTVSYGFNEKEEYKNFILLQILFGFLMFYYANWAEMFTHVLVTNGGDNIGVTESQFFFIFSLLFLSIFRKYLFNFFIFSINIKYYVSLAIILLTISQLYLVSKQEKLKFSHYKYFISYLLFFIFSVASIFIKENLLVLLIFTHGFVFCLMTLKAILSSVSIKEYQIIHYEVLVHCIVIFILFFIKNKFFYLLIWCIIEFIFLCDFIYCNIKNISKSLKIKVLTV